MAIERGNMTWNEWQEAITKDRIDKLLRFFHLKSRKNESYEISADDQKQLLKYLSGLHREITRLQEIEDSIKHHLDGNDITNCQRLMLHEILGNPATTAGFSTWKECEEK